MSYAQIYKQAIANGCTPKFADMLASRVAPGAKTDESLTRGMGTLDKQFDGDPSFPDLISEARRMGYEPNRNDVYMPALADRGLGDPLAFVPSGAGARGHVKKVAEKRNLNLVGLDTYHAREAEPTPDTVKK